MVCCTHGVLLISIKMMSRQDNRFQVTSVHISYHCVFHHISVIKKSITVYQSLCICHDFCNLSFNVFPLIILIPVFSISNDSLLILQVLRGGSNYSTRLCFQSICQYRILYNKNTRLNARTVIYHRANRVVYNLTIRHEDHELLRDFAHYITITRTSVKTFTITSLWDTSLSSQTYQSTRIFCIPFIIWLLLCLTRCDWSIDLLSSDPYVLKRWFDSLTEWRHHSVSQYVHVVWQAVMIGSSSPYSSLESIARSVSFKIHWRHSERLILQNFLVNETWFDRALFDSSSNHWRTLQTLNHTTSHCTSHDKSCIRCRVVHLTHKTETCQRSILVFTSLEHLVDFVQKLLHHITKSQNSSTIVRYEDDSWKCTNVVECKNVFLILWLVFDFYAKVFICITRISDLILK